MHFSLQNKPKNILKNLWIILTLFIIFGGILLYTYSKDNTYGNLELIFIIATIIASLIKSWRKKAFFEFDTTEQGIVVDGKTYLWTDIKYYSWYGERAAESWGRRRSLRPRSPEIFGNNRLARLHLGFGKNINLEVDGTQMENLSLIFNQYEIKHISNFKASIGI